MGGVRRILNGNGKSAFDRPKIAEYIVINLHVMSQYKFKHTSIVCFKYQISFGQIFKIGHTAMNTTSSIAAEV